MSPSNQIQQDEDFKNALAILKDLEKQRTDDNQVDKEKAEMIKSIEANIDECIKALLERKEALIQEVLTLFKERKVSMEVQQRTIQQTIKSCQDLIDLGSLMYSTNTEGAKKRWQLVEGLRFTSTATGYTVKLPSIVGTIQKHGSIERHGPIETKAAVSITTPSIFGDFVPREAAQAITTWLPNKKFTLIYKASRDGFGADNLHQQCDDKGPTITLIRSHPHNYLFGGYASVPWDSSTTDKIHPDSFIFTLTNPHAIPPTKYTNIPGHRAIYCKPSYGPAFGSGYDIVVKNASNDNKNSYTAFRGYADTTGKGNATFNGEQHFTTNEIEVYTVI